VAHAVSSATKASPAKVVTWVITIAASRKWSHAARQRAGAPATSASASGAVAARQNSSMAREHSSARASIAARISRSRAATTSNRAGSGARTASSRTNPRRPNSISADAVGDTRSPKAHIMSTFTASRPLNGAITRSSVTVGSRASASEIAPRSA